MSRRILVLFCLALLASSILPASARQDDLRQLYSTLASGHADFYNTVTAGEADDYVSQLSDKVDSMNDAQYWYALSSVAALAHDSHTSLQLSVSTLASFSFLPFQFVLLSRSARIFPLCIIITQYIIARSAGDFNIK